MNHKNYLSVVIILMLAATLQAQEINQAINTANDLYKQKQYAAAEKEYRRVLDIDSSNQVAQFNLGNSIYRAGKPAEASRVFNDLAIKEKAKEMRTNSFYNNGVMMTKQQKLEESIEAYKNALRTDPSDTMARENLQKALLELKKKNTPKKEEQKKDQKKPESPKSKMNKKEAEQKMKLLQQKEKEVQERLQKNSRSGASQPKDW